MNLVAALIGVACLAAGSAAFAAADQAQPPAEPAVVAAPAPSPAPANAASPPAPTAPPAASAAPTAAAAPEPATAPAATAAAAAPVAAPAAPTPDLAKADTASLAEGPVPPPPAGKSQVVFFRTGAYVGAAVWYNVRENGVVLGKLGNQAWFPVVLDPGVHSFTAATENRTSLRLELEPDETQYVRGTVQMGLLVGEPKLSPADKALFEQHYAHMKKAAAPAAQGETAPSR